ncbi:MAG: DUF5654 family protein [Patescibacteria group bacterium]
MEKLKRKVTMQIVTLLTGALGLIAALAWNEAVKALFVKFFGEANGLTAKFAYAVVVTIIVVWITMRLTKLQVQEEEAEKNQERKP